MLFDNYSHRAFGRKSLIVGALGAAAAASLAAATHPAAAASALAVVTSTVTCATSAACVVGTDTSTGAGVEGTSTKGAGVSGTTKTGRYGVYGLSPGNDGVAGFTTTGSASAGVYGSSPTGYGVYGNSPSGLGYGVEGNGATYGTVGISSKGSGVYAQAGEDGLIAYGGHDGAYAEGTYAGVEAIGDTYGLIGNSGVYPLMLQDNGSDVFWVTGSGNVNYTGSLIAVARVSYGATVNEYTPKTAAPTLEDTGTAQLIAGAAQVRLDSTFAAGIDPRAAYRVFLTPDGDTRGLYVAAKGPTGFTVRETQGGHGTLSFDYRIVATAFGQVGQRMAAVNTALLPQVAPRQAAPTLKAPPAP